MNPNDFKNSALKNAYQYFDKNIRSLPKNADGTINEEAGGFVANDVDAFRHAYVSGVFTQEYGEKTADFFGRLNEELPFGWYSKAKKT